MDFFERQDQARKRTRAQQAGEGSPQELDGAESSVESQSSGLHVVPPNAEGEPDGPAQSVTEVEVPQAADETAEATP